MATIHLLVAETLQTLDIASGERVIDEDLDWEWDFAGERRDFVVAAWNGAGSAGEEEGV